IYFDLFSGSRRVGRLDRAAINPNVTLLNQPLNRAPGNRRELAAQVSIQPLGRKGAFDGHDFSAGGHGGKSEVRGSGFQSLARLFHGRTKGTVYGVPALAGQTQFRHDSPSVSSRLYETTPCRLKPGLHTP